MPAPVEPRRETDSTNAPSVRSDVDQTIAGTSSGDPAVSGFGPPTATGEVGTLGPYRLVKELGKGGMGAVYATLDTRLDRQLALKVMLPEFAADADAKERFLREARAAAKIKHDNVVTVYEADERNGVPYIAMEFLEGYPLDQYLKQKGSPTIPQILRIAAETAAGLAAAHKIGLVHRDIKPGNLWLEAPHGRVKVLDFGLAKPLDAEVELTKSGVVMGTPAYMSPEQARGEKVDPRADLFSLGAVTYRLCTGRLPFTGPTTMAVLMALATEEPPPVRELNPAVPEPLAAVVHQLLSKRAAGRPQSAAEVVKRIRDITEGLAGQRGQSAEVSMSQPQVVQPQVVYVPIQVTAFEANPFADLDASSAERASGEVTEPTVDPKPARKKPGGSWLWPAVGFAALAALVVASVVIIIKNKDGRKTKIEAPDGSTITGNDKDGKTPAQVGPGGKPPVPDTSADRKAAEWVISQGGFVRVNGGGKNIKAAADLPKDRFTLIYVVLSSAQVSDADLVHLKDLKSLTWLTLGCPAVTNAGLVHLKDLKSLTFLALDGTKVSDEGLQHLKELQSLTGLHLPGTQVGDAGLVHLKELKNLQGLGLSFSKVTDAGLVHLKELKSLIALDLNNTPVSDAGMVHLQDLKSLTSLDVRKTKVTAKGLEALHAAVPGCRVEHDGGVIEAVDVDRKAAEWVIAQGGVVRVGGGDKDIKAATELPKERFTLTQVDLQGTAVSDAGLMNLKNPKGLTVIGLHNTQVSDAGLAHLKKIESLTVLFLNNTSISDAGLEHLKELTGLRSLNMRKTKVMAKGLAEFHAAVPGCRVEHDGGVIEAVDVDRKAAEWVIAQGGFISVNNRQIKAVADLPKERFALTSVSMDGTKVTDAGLAQLSDLTWLAGLNLNGTQVSDAGLVHLKRIKSLTGLHLNGTKVTDAGLAHLSELKGLQVLTLQGTEVTDVGLARLREFKALTGLNLVGTKVTAKGLAEFHAAVPGCKIGHDGGVIEPKK